MSKREKVNLSGLVRRGLFTVALLAGLVLLFSAPSGAQSTPEKSTQSTAEVAAPPSEKPSALKAAQSPANGRTEGIKVHGHWMIEVRNPDGKVVTHREFENSLKDATMLTWVLSRSLTIGFWRVSLTSTQAGMYPCSYVGGGTGPCVIVEPAESQSVAGDTSAFANLTLGLTSSNGFTLSGSAVAGANGQINQVDTNNKLCWSEISSASCATLGNVIPYTWTLTRTTITPAIDVSSGQTVAVNVTITFS